MVIDWTSALAPIVLAGIAMWLSLRVVHGRIRYALAPALGLVILLAGCSLYHHKFEVLPQAPNAPYDFHVVQSDDFGSFWNLEAAQSALDAVEAGAKTTNEIVVVFIHGWHHNADPKEPDENLRDFRLSLEALSTELAKPAYRHARESLTGDPNFRLAGIYVGWRGRSLPGYLDYGTMWWRKEAAERVGSGDVSEFLTRLQINYEKANYFDPTPGVDPRRRFMGLVSIGHSFGGQVLLKSVAPRLEGQLIAATKLLADTTPTQVEEKELQAPIRGLGDLNVLLNPALEAYQFNRIDSLYHQRSYPRSQIPQLVVFSADNDSARQTFFPLARALTAPFRASFRDSYQADQWSQALGELTWQRTHKLTLSDEPDSLTTEIYDHPSLEPLLAHDFTARNVFAGVALAPDESKRRVPYSPVEVIYTYNKIIDGHNGIFKDQFRAFLGKYIAFIEGKSLAARFDREKLYREERAKESPAR